MSFGGGSQQQTSATDSMGWAQSFMNQLGSTDSSSQGGSSSFVDPTQGGFLKSLYGQGQDLANPNAAIKAANRGVASVMPGMKQAFGNLGQLADPSKAIATGARSLKSGLGAMFRDEINPAIRTDALASGGFGGGRQGVAEGVAAGKLGDVYASGLGDITQAANATALGAAGEMGELGQGIYNLGVAPSMAGFEPLKAFSSLLGSPTVLNKAWQDAMSKARSRSSATNASVNASTTRAQASGWNFNAASYPG